MSNMDKVAALLAVGTDAERPAKERLAAMREADAIRAGMKTGWAKFGMPEAKQLIQDLEAASAAAEPFDQSEGPERKDNALRDAIRAVLQGAPDGGMTAQELADLTSSTAHEVNRVYGPEDGDLDDGSVLYAIIGATEPAASAEKPAKPAKAKADRPARAKKPPKEPRPVDPNRGAITAMVNELLMDPDLSYADIVAAVLAKHKEARTTARSVASVAADLRKEKGVDVPIRRKVAAPKPEKPAKAQKAA